MKLIFKLLLLTIAGILAIPFGLLGLLLKLIFMGFRAGWLIWFKKLRAFVLDEKTP